jgi:hypothetical protein
MEVRESTGTIRFEDWNGKEQTREVNYVIDIRDYRGRAGFPWLIVAANPHLSVRTLWHWLLLEGGHNPRSEGWIYKRRWMFQDPEKANKPGGQANVDGKDERAIQIMRENPILSARGLSLLLKKYGISRNKDWVWKHRCD